MPGLRRALVAMQQIIHFMKNQGVVFYDYMTPCKIGEETHLFWQIECVIWRKWNDLKQDFFCGHFEKKIHTQSPLNDSFWFLISCVIFWQMSFQKTFWKWEREVGATGMSFFLCIHISFERWYIFKRAYRCPEGSGHVSIWD